MINFIKSKPVVSALIGIVFILITRVVEIIPAVMIFWLISNLPDNIRSKKAMTGLSIAYIVLAILFSLLNLVIIILKFVEPYQTFTFVSFGFVGVSAILVLLLSVMFIVYVVLEKKETRDVLFAFVLLLPIIGTVYNVVDGYAMDQLFSLIQNNGENVVSLNLGQVSIFSTLKIMIPIFLLMKPKEEVYE